MELREIFRPMATRIRRAARGERRGIDQVAARSVEVSPDEPAVRGPAFFLEEHLDRIRGFIEISTESKQLARLRGGDVVHRGTRGYLIRDALFHRGHVFADGVCHALSFDPSPWVGTPKVAHHEAGAITTTATSQRWFGDFLMAESPTALLATEWDEVPYRYGNLGGHRAAYAGAFGIAYRHLEATALFDELWLFDDVGHNADRRRRYRRMRASLRASRDGHAPLDGTGVFIRRGHSGTERFLRNEAQLAEEFARRGFRVVSSDEPFGRVVDACLGAGIVVTVEGSQQQHGVLGIREGGVFVNIQPPDRVNLAVKDRLDALGARYAFVVGQGDSDGFEASLDDLLRVMDLAGATL